jgi:membrane associated rhomboid family serine protease
MTFRRVSLNGAGGRAGYGSATPEGPEELMTYYRQPPQRGPGVAIGFPPLTPMIKRIMIACGVVWGVQVLLDWGFSINLARYLGVVPADLTRGWVWQVFTYMWLHAVNDPFHILLNMLFLWMLGGDLERHWGPRAFLRYYLVCGIGAGVIISLAGQFSAPELRGIPTIGASGAVFGLILAFGMIFSERQILFMLIFPMRARTFAIVMAAVTFFFTVGRSPSTVSHVAHLGGMVVGYLYLKRAWRIREFVQELRWKMRRKKFRVMPPESKDDDHWVH